MQSKKKGKQEQKVIRNLFDLGVGSLFIKHPLRNLVLSISFKSAIIMDEPTLHTSLEMQHARRSAKRTRVATACIQCKFSRTKCSDTRPCTRCFRSGISSKCSDDSKSFVSSKVFLIIPSRCLCPPWLFLIKIFLLFLVSITASYAA